MNEKPDEQPEWARRLEAKIDAILKLNGQDPKKVEERLSPQSDPR